MYVVISDTMTTNSSINVYPVATRWAWLAILSAARVGIVTDLTPFRLSKMANITPEEADLAIVQLTSADPYSTNTDHEGRRMIPTGEPNEYELVSWAEYSALLAKAHAAKRAKDYRVGKSRQKARSVRKKATQEKVEGAISFFEDFWQVYPRRVSKAKASESWSNALLAGTPPELIIEGAKRYAAERAGEDPKFTAHPATWLNQRRWEDGGEKKAGVTDVRWS